MDLDTILQKLKGLERRFYDAEYRALQDQLAWMELPHDVGISEKVFDLAPPVEQVRSILIFKPDEIGDAVFALPAIQKLKEHFTHAKVSLLCQHKARAVYERSGLIDEIVSIDVKVRFLRFTSFNVKHALKQFARPDFDLSIFLRTYPAYFKQFKQVPARIRLHPLDPRLPSHSIYKAPVALWTRNRVHQALQMLQILGPVTGKRYSMADVAFPLFHWTNADREEVERVFNSLSKPYLVVHPFARYETRRYPMDYWKKILAELSARKRFSIVIVGGGEDPVIDGIEAVQLQGKLSLGATGYLMSQAFAFMGNEAGPAHWAAAIGTPTLMMMGGHSAPREWAPLRDSVVLRAEVPCAPCHRRTCPEYQVACLSALTPERVLLEVEEFLYTRLAKKAPRASTKPVREPQLDA